MRYLDNPFLILDVTSEDNRRTIVAQAEEQALYFDAERCNEARNTLTNPQRRISAEVRWFLGCNKITCNEIQELISDVCDEEMDDIPLRYYSDLTKLNINIACLEKRHMGNSSDGCFVRSFVFNCANTESNGFHCICICNHLYSYRRKKKDNLDCARK